MNSAYAAAQWAQRSGVEARASSSSSFARLLEPTPAEESGIAAPQEGTEHEPIESPPPPSQAAEPEPESPSPRLRSSVPHFLSVAESLQYPRGPYRQAPEEHGGEWWLTNPFTGLEPWLTQGFGNQRPAAEAPELDPGFVAVFGPRPSRATHPNPMLRNAAVADWERNLEHFHGVGVPEGFTQEQVDAAGALFEAWGMGRPVFYEGRYGWRAKFPGAELAGFEAAPFTALEAPHLVVARYQVALAEEGSTPTIRHPFVPPQVFGDQPVNA